MKEGKIVRVSLVNAQGAETYEIGYRGVETIDEEVKQIHEEARATFYVCKDKDGNLVALISANAPVVIDYE